MEKDEKNIWRCISAKIDKGEIIMSTAVPSSK